MDGAGWLDRSMWIVAARSQAPRSRPIWMDRRRPLSPAPMMHSGVHDNRGQNDDEFRLVHGQRAAGMLRYGPKSDTIQVPGNTGRWDQAKGLCQVTMKMDAQL